MNCCIFSIMEFRPKHPQPFSLSEALKFDPATITEGSTLLSSDDSSY
jgi:hypothetical protein